MTGALSALATSLALAALAGWAIPAAGMRVLWPSVSAGAPRVRNYRGGEVAVGLGVVWMLWAVSVAVIQPVWSSVGLGSLMGDGRTASAIGVAIVGAAPDLPWALVIGAFAFGLVDDVFGDRDARGFRGHLAALRRGRLTTGGLKLLGIGALSAVSAAGLSLRDASAASGAAAGWTAVAAWALATLVIALTANLVNLLDLRPGRALKGYAVLASVACLAAGWRVLQVPSADLALPSGVLAAGVTVAAGLLLLGPVPAVWRLDLGERGMLGDAGANAMGALAGYGIASGLPLSGLALAAAVLAALNLLSERVSFSRVIEESAWLSRVDRLGTRDREAMTGSGRDAAVGRREDTGTGDRKDGAS